MGILVSRGYSQRKVQCGCFCGKMCAGAIPQLHLILTAAMRQLVVL